MNLDYATCLILKEAGFPQDGLIQIEHVNDFGFRSEPVGCPTTDELLEQMPVGTRLRKCRSDYGARSDDGCESWFADSPALALAEAYIAWRE